MVNRTNGHKILVVDDEMGVRQYLSQLLTKENYDVDTANSASDALKMIENKRYGLILLDIKMPGMSGIELYQHIQKIARSLARRVVFITGDVMGIDVQSFLNKSKATYISKPFDTKELIKRVNRLLTERT